MTLPELSIIIPTLNEAESLPLLLADLARQREVAFEVIVSDGGSTDSTCAVARDFFLSQDKVNLMRRIHSATYLCSMGRLSMQDTVYA